MFRKAISSTPFSTPIADNIMSAIQGGDYNGDTTFISTLRALVFPRLKPDDTLYLQFNSIGNNKTSGTIIGRYVPIPGENDNPHLKIVNIASSRGWFECLSEDFPKENEGWSELEKVPLFFEKEFKTKAFVNPEQKHAVVFVENLNNAKMHYLQCGIVAFLPWYFPPEAGVTEDEMNLIRSLRERNSARYEECIKKLAEQYDFRSEMIKCSLSGFETLFERQKTEEIRSTIDSYYSQINEYNAQIASYMTAIRDNELRLTGLLQRIADGATSSEMMDYFLANKNLVLNSADGTKITFTARSYVTYWDEEYARKAIESRNSFLYSDISSGMVENIRRLMKAVFLDQTLKMKFCARYILDAGRQSVAGRKHVSDYGMDFNDCLPNPHIDRYECLGTYISAICDCLRNSDYLGAVEQCIASCGTLNFTDSTVMGEFMRTISSSNDKFIELPDGTMVNPREACEYIEGLEATDTDENKEEVENGEEN
jgi:hypothetical protein